MGKNEIDILLSLDDKASKNLDQFDKKAKGLKDTFKKSAVEINASLELMQKGLQAVGKAFEFIERGAKFEQQREAFNKLAKSAGVSADEVIKAMQDMAGGTISAAEAIGGATKAMVLGLSPDKLPKLMEIARVSARAFGTDVGFMFDSLSLGIGRQSRMLLDNLGIIVSAEDAYKKYAEVNGLVASALTDAEKKQAFLNAALEAGQMQIDKMGGSALTQAENIAKMKASLKDLIDTLAVIASKLIAFQRAISTATKLLEGLKIILDNINNIDIQLSADFKSMSPALDNANKALVKLSAERDKYQQMIQKGYVGGEVAQQRLNDMLVNEKRLRESIVALRVGVTGISEEKGQIDKERELTEEKQIIFQESLEERTAALQEFQSKIQTMSDSEIAKEVTKLEQMANLNKTLEENKTAILKTESDKRDKIKNKVALYEKQLLLQGMDTTIAVLGAIAGESKAVAVAMKVLSVSKAIISAHLAYATTLAELGIVGLPLAKAALVLGYIQAAAIAATPMAEGGIVKARPGGIIARIGEGGQDEAVIPLNKAGQFGDINIFIQGGINPGGSSINEMAEQLGFAFERELRTARG